MLLLLLTGSQLNTNEIEKVEDDSREQVWFGKRGPRYYQRIREAGDPRIGLSNSTNARKSCPPTPYTPFRAS